MAIEELYYSVTKIAVITVLEHNNFEFDLITTISAKGIEKGKEITLVTTARKMILESIPLEIIAKITGFDPQKLMELQKRV
ncbi:MAG: hypothetical protein LBM60_02790 [Clostridium sp.]|jgi:hypothetical protein|nr:hypothetical protein [Clostridium sp.]